MFKTGKIKLNPEINLPFNFVIQKYFFYDNPTWNINYLEYLLMVKKIRQKESGKKGNWNLIRIDKFELELTK